MEKQDLRFLFLGSALIIAGAILVGAFAIFIGNMRASGTAYFSLGSIPLILIAGIVMMASGLVILLVPRNKTP